MWMRLFAWAVGWLEHRRKRDLCEDPALFYRLASAIVKSLDRWRSGRSGGMTLVRVRGLNSSAQQDRFTARAALRLDTTL
ncbi:hypothetical protein DHEL01_v202807 [Diaporthe helianthi]|uniref:Uncharacterized protein n=1 Tax=Diaporthe helianthi TaxID=158607 RepID=A0A2P5I8G3_DIAHE|nr:hypothetical protein DHEL01_v202807 [Diaporthe helianthi]